MYNIGIIGCGKIAQVRHIPEYTDNKNATIAAYYDLNTQRAQELANQYGGKVYPSYEEILADPEIDAVSVCTANSSHAQITIEALKAGKHVLCEKPMATTLEDCEEMVLAAKQSGKFLMIGQNQRLTKAHARAKQLLNEGIIGDVITFRTTFGHGGPETWSIDSGKNTWFFDKNKAAMGAMADLGIHKTDLIQFLLGQTVTETTAIITTLDKKDANGNLIGVDDNAVCIYKMSGGALGTMTASWTYYGEEDNSTILYGTKGMMCIYDDPVYSITVTTASGENIYYQIDKIQTNDNQTKSGVIDEFVDCLVNNKAPAISGESVLTAMRAVFASIQSSQTGRTVAVRQLDKGE
ncbi:putative dehydrogenase [Hydrogenoanaerobacterium saccharovorans]|uniref:Predicted dehydrogenase n=1 Tax=Hydrogenoanaerobacterium saccharovorans TaxID=474960 RepID=A0A1H8E8T3_9FIRM|nr:Gfo/Idh/MocA family oxidoreductase [Hydrogenoanaerobacterium saccharovorans]RPF41965.1 putative dehydrogenase [Hydrogenoanaerobacterium saccharovorans]SEN15267.1 Predicted dehydrogenase [Hydrogenoanaerobacterium saccharovorans]